MVSSKNAYTTLGHENNYMAYYPMSTSPHREEPLNKESLGNMSWSVLHTISVNYPDKPTMEEQNTMKSFLMNFAKVYPCRQCGDSFEESIRKCPPQVQSQTQLIKWLCFQHNIVNRKLNKPIFDCTKSNYEARWLQK